MLTNVTESNTELLLNFYHKVIAMLISKYTFYYSKANLLQGIGSVPLYVLFQVVLRDKIIKNGYVKQG